MEIETQSPVLYWDNQTRFLHLGLALFITLELFNSLVMQEHISGSGLGGLMFEVHEWAGMGALAIILAHWWWSIWGTSNESIRHLFPWGSDDRVQIWRELRDLLSLRLPPGGPRGRLAGLVHGFGFLAVTVMALTGAVLFFWLPEGGGEPGPLIEGSEEIHEILSTFVWSYWGAHVSMAVLHELLARDGTLRRMFTLS
jgi:cytochrome b561